MCHIFTINVINATCRKRNARQRNSPPDIVLNRHIPTAHQHRPQGRIPFSAYITPKAMPVKQISRQYRNRVRKCFLKCLFIPSHPSAPFQHVLSFFFSAYRHKKYSLGGIEPPQLPPEGIALSTELQTYKKQHPVCFYPNRVTLNYPSIIPADL